MVMGRERQQNDSFVYGCIQANASCLLATLQPPALQVQLCSPYKCCYVHPVHKSIFKSLPTALPTALPWCIAEAISLAAAPRVRRAGGGVVGDLPSDRRGWPMGWPRHHAGGRRYTHTPAHTHTPCVLTNLWWKSC